MCEITVCVLHLLLGPTSQCADILLDTVLCSEMVLVRKSEMTDAGLKMSGAENESNRKENGKSKNVCVVVNLCSVGEITRFL